MVSVPFLAWILFSSLSSTTGSISKPQEALVSKKQGPVVMGYAVVASYPHDSRAFSQGLEYEQLCRPAEEEREQGCTDTLWESTGGCKCVHVTYCVVITKEERKAERG